MRRTLLYAALALSWSGCTCNSEVTIAPPKVPYGGRAVAIAVALSDARRLVVASESGGLFRTFDGGKSFQHLDGFPTFAPVDVAISSTDPNTIIATARDDLRTISGGGVWRSTDGGASWRRPAGWPPAPSLTCPDRPEARGISHMPLTRTFHVATDCGIAVSTDNGASFSTVVLDPFSSKIRDVMVLNRTTGVAADGERIWFLNGGTWQQASGGPESAVEFAIHSFASPWWTGSPIFYHAASDREVYFSTDAGATWTFMETPPHGGGREKFVRVGRSLDGDATRFDVYFGDGFTHWRQRVSMSAPGGTNTWEQPKIVDHVDPADIAFTPGHEVPLMLATDGGVHLTPDSGRTWSLTGSNSGGFAALQIGEVTGRAVGGATPHLDLYYSTQDNDIKGSSDGGKTWNGSIAHEGAFLQADAANPAQVDGPVTGRRCGGCALFEAIPHLGSTQDPPPFRSAPDGNPANRADPPFQLIGATYVQGFQAAGPTPTFAYFLTRDRGATWDPAFSIPFKPVGLMRFAGNLENPVAYVAAQRSFRVGLFRVQDVTGQATVRRADSTGILSLAILGTGQGRYGVFGVDPSNPDHLLAPDAVSSTMNASVDGGVSWFEVTALTTAVTDSGRFLVTRQGTPSVSTIAWDPTNSCHILVGTMQNGIIRSADGGLTWRRVAGSDAVTYITSFYFPPSGAIWMSTYGRGLWNVNVDRRPPSGGCRFPDPPGGTPIEPDTLFAWPYPGGELRPFGGLRDPIVCPTCTVLSSHEGWITDVVTKGPSVTGVATSSGLLAERDGAGKDVPLSVPNTYRMTEGEGVRRLVGREIVGTRRVRALVLRGTELVALVLGRTTLPNPGVRAPQIVVASTGGSLDPSVVVSGDSVVVRGYGFLAGRNGNGVEIHVGETTPVSRIDVASDGRFTAAVRVSRGPGTLEVRAVQRDGKRVTVEQAQMTVVAREEEAVTLKN